MPLLARVRHRAMRKVLWTLFPASCLFSFLLYIAIRGPSDRCSPYQRQVSSPVQWDASDIAAVRAREERGQRPADGPGSDASKMQAVKSAFLTNYGNYSQYAWGCNILEPLSLSGSSNQGRIGAFGATIIDSLTTMIVMDIHTEEEHSHHFAQALNFTQHLDFNRTKGGDKCTGCISVFEATIRYIGSLLSTWELLSTPPKHQWLVTQAETLARSLSPGFVYTIPYNYVNINKGQPRNTFESGSLAAVGTLLLEWSRLSTHTGNRTYVDKVRATQRALMQAGDVLPGLVGSNVYSASGKISGKAGTLVTYGPGGDSYYEVSRRGTVTGREVARVYLRSKRIASWSLAPQYIAKALLLRDNTLDNEAYLSTFKKAWKSTEELIITKSGGSTKK